MKLGAHSYCLGTDKGETTVGKFTSIAGGTYFHGADNHAWVYDRKLVSTFDFGDWNVDFTKSGQTTHYTIIGNDVWIGEYAQIMSGVYIGDGAIVGAHTVVGKDVPPYAIVVGNPMEIKSFRFTAPIIQQLLNIKWWDWDDQTIQGRLGEFRDVKAFVEKYGEKT